MAFPTDTIAIIIALVSAHALYLSSVSIPKLKKYEERAKKAAEWSNVAEKRLWDTRYTVGAGFVATVISLFSALVYAIFVSPHAGLLSWAKAWPFLMSAGVYYVCQYMRSFWDSKAKIPMLDEYNDAISDTTKVIWLLQLLVGGWGVVALLKFVGL